ncbi:DUF255 domain-containing protein [Streptomyces sp. OF8]|uniref:DUF255 domain-containing protein n=1 Tax=Streptomyces alkaliterrae TaxID=2213162 RepID=A0A7W3ZRY9_9ACTN|nr:DUF255 domain-containing protein [Streptomyces alkaliterrae]MBB1258132.1 DUF255 domain-containing protein [Streptomyces alkaliterrae]
MARCSHRPTADRGHRPDRPRSCDDAGINRLANSQSPYLVQHADNPVIAGPGEAAFEEARRRDVPVVLSVGYSNCHWCQ